MAEGRKDDTGKLRFDLIPPHPLESIAEVYTIGAKKYADRNWERGIQYGRLFAAMMRHAWKWWKGEERDQVDGQLHLASVAWCAIALMEFAHTHPELDDRPYSSPKDPIEGGRHIFPAPTHPFPVGGCVPVSGDPNQYSPQAIWDLQNKYGKLQGAENKEGPMQTVERSEPKTWRNPTGGVC
jgi:hypothetical protein